jgi:hypothetical protein
MGRQARDVETRRLIIIPLARRMRIILAHEKEDTMSKRPAHTYTRLHATMSDAQYVRSPEGRAALAVVVTDMKAWLKALKSARLAATAPKTKAKPKQAASPKPKAA